MSRTARANKRNPVTARRGPSLNAVLTGVVVLVAVLVIGGVLVLDRSGGASSGTLVPPDAHTLSKADGDEVTLVEFLDFQCPACASYYTGVTKKLEQDYRGRITFVTRNFPLEGHPLAVPAARAAEAAGKQGKYAEMYHALYDNFDTWATDGRSTSADTARATAKFEEFATAAGLDLERFRADSASAEVQAVIDRDVADGTALGVDSTPTFFLDGEEFSAGGSTIADAERELRARIDAALAG
ncbi:protein-disulfide isomerase [Saccharothrix coeruleofusca]|uniref:DsbA family protein n=1 Tax=Saccharothrix coeruleofusca TaxID=33919 RepID=UPI001AE2BBB4|nr:thioredoxin domain-containing protein [Saccharothrix coeruleofusca]MBP2335650.1 protein-disulfide isomerase [Saccharothrix coeruleofusca]